MKGLWNKIKNSIPIKVIKKENLKSICDEVDKQIKRNYNLQYDNEQSIKRIKLLEEKIIPAMPMIYGLKSQLDYKDRLLYFTVTLDSEIFYRMPQVNGGIDYIADYICHSIRRELSMINISRLPDYCRKIKRDRYDQKEIKANLYTSGKIEER
jgi:hypothetical protein